MTDQKSHPCLPLGSVRSMAELLRRPQTTRVSAHGRGNRDQEGGSLLAGERCTRKGPAMLPPEIQCVVGIDVAKQAHVVCALEAPSGAVRHKPSRIEATADGYALLRAWLETWGAAERLLIGLEATGPLWEPLYEHLTQAGYVVLLLNPRQTPSWASSPGLRAKTD